MFLLLGLFEGVRSEIQGVVIGNFNGTVLALRNPGLPGSPSPGSTIKGHRPPLKEVVNENIFMMIMEF